MVFEASDVFSLLRAFKIAREMRLKTLYVRAGDEYRLRDLVAAEKPDLVLASTSRDPTSWTTTSSGSTFHSSGCARAGVSVAITEGDSSLVRNLAHQASVAMAYGMPREKALAAITLEPARILGIADRVGSIEPGKDATLFVADRDVLDFRYGVVAAYVDGRPLDLSDRHKSLYERYLNRPKREIK